MPQHTKNIKKGGKALSEASKAMIMIHGRGASADSILELAEELTVQDFTLLAPQATEHTWYPYSFMAPKAQNEPGLSSALKILEELITEIKEAGIKDENIYFLGFSQGACLTAEFVARNATKYGGVFILSGGLIGDSLETAFYQGNFAGTSVFLGCSDVDAHIPLSRVQESVSVFKDMGAEVTERIYPNASHTVFEDEINIMNQILSKN